LMPSCAGFLEPVKSRLEPLKSTSNTENFSHSFSMSISIDFGAFTLEMCIAAENHQKFVKTFILAFKVIEFGGNREPVYDFLLMINNNPGPISNRF